MIDIIAIDEFDLFILTVINPDIVIRAECGQENRPVSGEVVRCLR